MKAIIVIDMPDWCGKIADNDAEIWLRNYKISTEYSFFNVPLKPMPSKKRIEERWYSVDYSYGWNDCIEEIKK